MNKKILIMLSVVAAMGLTSCSGVDDKDGKKGGENSPPVVVQPPVAEDLKGYWHGWTDIVMREKDPNTQTDKEKIVMELAQATSSTTGHTSFLNVITEDGQAAFLLIKKTDNFLKDNEARDNRLAYMVLGKVEDKKLIGTAYDMTTFKDGDKKYIKSPLENRIEVPMRQSFPVEMEFKVNDEDPSFGKFADLEYKNFIPNFILFTKKAVRYTHKNQMNADGSVKTQASLKNAKLVTNDEYICNGYTDGIELRGKAAWLTDWRIKFKVQANQVLLHDSVSVNDDGSDCNIKIQTSVIAETTTEKEDAKESMPSQYNVTADINTCTYGSRTLSYKNPNLEANDYKGIAVAYKGGLNVYMASENKRTPVFLRCGK